MVAVDSDHYPERLGSVIIINAPAMLSWAWRIVQGFLADSQKAKVRIFGCDVEEWQSAIFEMINEDQIPVEYGGMDILVLYYFSGKLH
jgi:CRAL/TRIO domain